MTIHEAIQAADAAREGNSVSDIQMTKWLSYVDGRVLEELIITHRDDLTTRQEQISGYDERITRLASRLAEDIPEEQKSRIRDEIITIRQERDRFAMADYSELDPDAELYIRAPFEDVYLYYLLARIDLLNRESSSHNDNMRQFYTEWKRYANWFNRNSTPLGSRDIRW